MSRLRGSGVVVTGGAGGIGVALAQRFATAGARVLIADRDTEAVRRIAADLDVTGIATDVATSSGIEQILQAAAETIGPIELFCANAGVAPQGGPGAADGVWDRGWEVNVMAHVRAARALLPGWLERGSGRFVATVSAAGLLTSLGSAPYAVTKHAALAFAEWLAATYRHRGIAVHAVCPQGVRTPMLAETGAAGRLLTEAGAVEPEVVADCLIDAISHDRFLVLPHPEVADMALRRVSDTDRWLGAMNRLQQKLD